MSFNAKVGRQNTFKSTIGNESTSGQYDNGVRITKCATSKKSSCLEHDVPTPKHSYVHLDLS